MPNIQAYLDTLVLLCYMLVDPDNACAVCSCVCIFAVYMYVCIFVQHFRINMDIRNSNDYMMYPWWILLWRTAEKLADALN